MHLKSRLLTLGFLVCVTSCDKQGEPISAHYEVVTDISHTMKFIIDPAADVIWDSSGSIITATGEQDLAPATPDAWTKVEAAAAVLAESGNLLMMPGRSAGPDWNKHSSDLISAGKLAMAAAEQQDASALFDAGGSLYQVCLACHNQYLIDKSAQ